MSGFPLAVKARYVRGPRHITTRSGRTSSRPASVASQLGAHLKYVEYRAYGEHENHESRAFFSAKADQEQREDVQTAILKNTHPSVAFWRVVLSFEQTPENPMEAVRAVMHELEREPGRQYAIDWHAAIHRNTDHVHAHIILPGRVTGFDGKAHVLRFDASKGDFDRIHQLGRDLFGTALDARALHATQQQRDQEREREAATFRDQAAHAREEAAQGMSDPQPMKERAALHARGLPLTPADAARLHAHTSAQKEQKVNTPTSSQQSTPKPTESAQAAQSRGLLRPTSSASTPARQNAPGYQKEHAVRAPAPRAASSAPAQGHAPAAAAPRPAPRPIARQRSTRP